VLIDPTAVSHLLTHGGSVQAQRGGRVTINCEINVLLITQTILYKDILCGRFTPNRMHHHNPIHNLSKGVTVCHHHESIATKPSILHGIIAPAHSASTILFVMPTQKEL
jgi:hypothetical protein